MYSVCSARFRDSASLRLYYVWDPMSAGPYVWRWAPAGVVENTKWWSGRSRYYGGRAPGLARMVELPDDVLRCVCEHLAPMNPPEEKPRQHHSGQMLYRYGEPQSNEEFVAEGVRFLYTRTAHRFSSRPVSSPPRQTSAAA